MTYKTLLVHVDDSRRCDTRVALALDLARRWDAHLIGLYLVCQDFAGPLPRQDAGLVARLAAQAAERRAQAGHAFAAAAQRAGCAVEWRAPEGEPLHVATLHARHADLLVLGQADPHDPASYVARHFVGDLVLAAGRPAVVIPRAGAVPGIGENVLIAWDGSREAARAVADAMPLLRRARFVAVDIVKRGDDYNAAPGAIDVAAWLATHGVRASFSTTPRRGVAGTGATLLSRASDLHADLLVMGAYAHSRARERVWGGVTRTMLESMSLPVLMSH